MSSRGLLGGAVIAVAATAIFAACGSSTPSGAATVARSARASGIGLQRIGVFSQPVYLAAAPGDPHRLFVVERAGRIVVLVRGQRRARPFLDISGQVNSSGTEQGLLSMAFAPDYQTCGRFYVYYTDSSNNIRIVQYRRARSDADRADTASARTVLTIDHHTESNHNGGQLQFGPDGDLYVGVGDGGSEGDPHNYGQNTGVLLGKLLRIAPRPSGGYTIPPGNPFVNERRAASGDLGLRAAQSVALLVRPATGDLIVGDVGQDTEEEVDFARAATVPAPTTAGASSRGIGATSPAPRLARSSPRSSPATATATARSSAATWSATRRFTRSTAATSSATTASRRSTLSS